MKLLLLAGLLSFSIAAVALADDCAGKLTDQEKQTNASLSPANQQALANMKMKDGSPANCDFRAGVLDMLVHYPPEKRDEGFQQLLQHTFVNQG